MNIISVNGANLNSICKNAAKTLSKSNGNASFKANNRLFSKRFDTIELSDFFKRFSSAGNTGNQADKIRKMLSETENSETAERYAKGIADYAYMEMALVGEALRTDNAAFRFSNYSEQKEYYQSLLDKADGISAGADTACSNSNSIYDRISAENEQPERENRIRNGYEYVPEADGIIDRNKAEQALNNVQQKIDQLIEDTRNSKHSNKIDIGTFNKCANGFAEAFGADADALVLNESEYEKLFGTPDVTENDFLEKMNEKSENLWSGYRNVKKQFEDCLERIRTETDDGKNLVENIRSALSDYEESMLLLKYGNTEMINSLLG
ncbi:MAG: hypothetical protein ACI4SF_14015 [Oscillospiraceae bacterium]